MKVEISVNSESYSRRDRNPDDQWDAGETGLHIHGVEVKHTNKDYGFEIEGATGDLGVVLVEHYEDGNTFGCDEFTEVKGIFRSRAEAEHYARSLNTNHGYFGAHIDFLYFNVELPGIP